jgi:hypothetical protein
MIVYQEKQEGDGEWSEIKYLELQLPNRWNLAGDIVNHRSFFIFHRDIYQQLD